MSSRVRSFQRLVQDFFVQHLAIERNASPNTIASYRDAIKLFLDYASEATRSSPDQLDHDVLGPESVRGFLRWLESQRRCGPRTRNQRLAALKSFARYVATVAPEHLEGCRLVREIRPARTDHKEIQFLAEDEVVQLFSSFDAATPHSRRDRALLLLLYNTGARVQEVANLDVGDVDNGEIPFVRLFGKGRKHRTCPIWARTKDAIHRMLSDRAQLDDSQPLFLSARRQRLSRSGITHLLRRAQRNSGLQPRRAKRLSPHIIRHTTAMHLLRSGVDITTIAAWLGHSQLATTHGYIEIDLRTKQAAMANQTALPEACSGKYPSSKLIDWLESIGRRTGYVECTVATIPTQRPTARHST